MDTATPREWLVLCFQPGVKDWIKSHACSPDVVDLVLQDLLTRYNDDLDYVVSDHDYGLDLPGMIHLKRPIEKFDVNGLAFKVPSECVVAIKFAFAEAIKSCEDKPFVKVRNYGSCVCVTHEEAEMLYAQLDARSVEACRRSDEFYASFNAPYTVSQQ